MIEEFLKDKKKIGIFIVLLIVIISAAVLYKFSGFKELKKNDTENIFVDDGSFVEENNDDNYGDNKSFKEDKGNSSSTSSKVSKINTSEKTITVEIKGEVKKPDVYILKENSIVKDLIEEAGGLTEEADISSINRAKQLQNHELIYICNKNQEANTSVNASNEKTQEQLGTNTQINSKVNINSATVEEFKTLKGIGDSKANNIVDYRENNGPFNSIEDIKNVDGIGEKMFEKIKDSLTV